MRNLILALISASVVSACGGGGESSPTTAAAAATHFKLAATSYENMKLGGTAAQYSTVERGIAAIGIGNFSGSTSAQLFSAKVRYSLTETPATALRSNFVFTDLNTGVLVTLPGCLHPRKAAVADFNGDGRADVFVACHGFDAPPFTGEQSRLVISGAQGPTVRDFTEMGIAFAHGAAAADLDGDGLVDLVVTDGQAQLKFFRNTGGGSFTTWSPQLKNMGTVGPIYSVEALDVDRDGLVDLVVGGHGPGARVLFGGNDGSFGSRVFNIPTVAGREVVLDFTVVGSSLIISRTSDSGSPLGSYATRTIQQVDMPTSRSVIIEDRVSDSTWNPDNQWLIWSLPTSTGVVAYDNPSQLYKLK